MMIQFDWKLDPHVNILGGPCGSGKTTILEILRDRFVKEGKTVVYVRDMDLDGEEIDEDVLKILPNPSRGQQRLSILYKAIKIKPDVLIIDNPEIWLHVDIQKKLLTNLRSISLDTQIIVATHGPSIIDGWYDRVKEISQILINV